MMAQQMMMLQQQLLQQQMQQALLNQQLAASAQQQQQQQQQMRPPRPQGTRGRPQNNPTSDAEDVANAPSPKPDDDADGAPLAQAGAATDGAGDQQATGLMTQEDMEAAAFAGMGFTAGDQVPHEGGASQARRGKRPAGGELRGAGGARAGGSSGGAPGHGKWKVTRVLEVKVS